MEQLEPGESWLFVVRNRWRRRVMQTWRYGVLAALGVLATQVRADPNLDKQYQAMRQAYYQFDTHSFNKLTCHVDVSGLDASVGNLKQAFVTHADSLQMKDDLASYSLTVEPGSGLSINNPTLDIELISNKGVADPDRVKLGIQQTKTGFDQQVQGADQIISSVFNEYLDVVPELESVTHQGKKWVILYHLGPYETIETVEGKRIHEESNNGQLKFVTDADYMVVTSDKLAVQKSIMHFTEGSESLNSTMSVTYQKLGPLYLPASITTISSLSTSGVGQTSASTTITFEGCSLKD
jgi:hypothetical protein